MMDFCGAGNALTYTILGLGKEKEIGRTKKCPAYLE
jgi:hypothetical protein